MAAPIVILNGGGGSLANYQAAKAMGFGGIGGAANGGSACGMYANQTGCHDRFAGVNGTNLFAGPTGNPLNVNTDAQYTSMRNAKADCANAHAAGLKYYVGLPWYNIFWSAQDPDPTFAGPMLGGWEGADQTSHIPAVPLGGPPAGYTGYLDQRGQSWPDWYQMMADFGDALDFIGADGIWYDNEDNRTVSNMQWSWQTWANNFGNPTTPAAVTITGSGAGNNLSWQHASTQAKTQAWAKIAGANMMRAINDGRTDLHAANGHNYDVVGYMSAAGKNGNLPGGFFDQPSFGGSTTRTVYWPAGPGAVGGYVTLPNATLAATSTWMYWLAGMASQTTGLVQLGNSCFYAPGSVTPTNVGYDNTAMANLAALLNGSPGAPGGFVLPSNMKQSLMLWLLVDTFVKVNFQGTDWGQAAWNNSLATLLSQAAISGTYNIYFAQQSWGADAGTSMSASFTNGSKTVTGGSFNYNANAPPTSQSQVGFVLIGTGFPYLCYIAQVTSATTAVLSANYTGATGTQSFVLHKQPYNVDYSSDAYSSTAPGSPADYTPLNGGSAGPPVYTTSNDQVKVAFGAGTPIATEAINLVQQSPVSSYVGIQTASSFVVTLPAQPRQGDLLAFVVSGTWTGGGSGQSDTPQFIPSTAAATNAGVTSWNTINIGNNVDYDKAIVCYGFVGTNPSASKALTVTVIPSGVGNVPGSTQTQQSVLAEFANVAAFDQAVGQGLYSPAGTAINLGATPLTPVRVGELLIAVGSCFPNGPTALLGAPWQTLGSPTAETVNGTGTLPGFGAWQVATSQAPVNPSFAIPASQAAAHATVAAFLPLAGTSSLSLSGDQVKAAFAGSTPSPFTTSVLTIQHVQDSAPSTSTVSPIALHLPALPVVGDWLTLKFGGGGGTTVPALAVSGGGVSSWAYQTNTTGLARSLIAYGKVDTTPSQTVTVTVTSGDLNGGEQCVVSEDRNIGNVDVAGGATGTSITAAPGAITPGAASELVVVAYGTPEHFATTPAGYTSIGLTTHSGMDGWLLDPTAAPQNPSVQLGASFVWASSIATFKVAGSTTALPSQVGIGFAGATTNFVTRVPEPGVSQIAIGWSSAPGISETSIPSSTVAITWAGAQSTTQVAEAELVAVAWAASGSPSFVVSAASVLYWAQTSRDIARTAAVHMMGNVAGPGSSVPSSLDTSFLTAMGADPATSGLNMLLDSTSTWASVQSDAQTILATMGSWTGWPKMFDLNMQASTSDNTLSDVINQNSDVLACFTGVAQAAYANGVSFIRMGWEFQGFYSGVTSTAFVAAWQSIVTMMNAAPGVPPGYFQFVWNPNGGAAGNPITWPSPYFPGAAYVGCIAIDLYHMGGTGFSSWLSGPHPNLNDIVALAQSTGVNCVAIPEWGVVNTNPPGDIVAQIDGVMSWAQATAALGIDVILGVFGRGWPTTTGTFGMQCTPAAFTELSSQVAAGRAAGWIAPYQAGMTQAMWNQLSADGFTDVVVNIGAFSDFGGVDKFTGPGTNGGGTPTSSVAYRLENALQAQAAMAHAATPTPMLIHLSVALEDGLIENETPCVDWVTGNWGAPGTAGSWNNSMANLGAAVAWMGFDGAAFDTLGDGNMSWQWTAGNNAATQALQAAQVTTRAAAMMTALQGGYSAAMTALGTPVTANMLPVYIYVSQLAGGFPGCYNQLYLDSVAQPEQIATSVFAPFVQGLSTASAGPIVCLDSAFFSFANVMSGPYGAFDPATAFTAALNDNAANFFALNLPANVYLTPFVWLTDNIPANGGTATWTEAQWAGVLSALLGGAQDNYLGVFQFTPPLTAGAFSVDYTSYAGNDYTPLNAGEITTYNPSGQVTVGFGAGSTGVFVTNAALQIIHMQDSPPSTITTSPYTLTLTNNPLPGDWLTVIMGGASNSALPTFTVAGGGVTSWTVVTLAGTLARTSIAFGKVDTTPSKTVTVTFTGNLNQGQQSVAQEWQNIGGLDVQTGATGSGALAAPGSQTPAVMNDLRLVVYATGNHFTAGPAGYAQLGNINDSAIGGWLIDPGETAENPSVPLTSGPWVAFQVAFFPAQVPTATGQVAVAFGASSTTLVTQVPVVGTSQVAVAFVGASTSAAPIYAAQLAVAFTGQTATATLATGSAQVGAAFAAAGGLSFSTITGTIGYVQASPPSTATTAIVLTLPALPAVGDWLVVPIGGYYSAAVSGLPYLAPSGGGVTTWVLGVDKNWSSRVSAMIWYGKVTGTPSKTITIGVDQGVTAQQSVALEFSNFGGVDKSLSNAATTTGSASPGSITPAILGQEVFIASYGQSGAWASGPAGWNIVGATGQAGLAAWLGAIPGAENPAANIGSLTEYWSAAMLGFLPGVTDYQPSSSQLAVSFGAAGAPTVIAPAITAAVAVAFTTGGTPTLIEPPSTGQVALAFGAASSTLVPTTFITGTNQAAVAFAAAGTPTLPAPQADTGAVAVGWAGATTAITQVPTIGTANIPIAFSGTASPTTPALQFSQITGFFTGAATMTETPTTSGLVRVGWTGSVITTPAVAGAQVAVAWAGVGAVASILASMVAIAWAGATPTTLVETGGVITAASYWTGGMGIGAMGAAGMGYSDSLAPWDTAVRALSPISWWKMNESAGTAVKDYGSANSVGTTHGSPVLGVAGPVPGSLAETVMGFTAASDQFITAVEKAGYELGTSTSMTMAMIAKTTYAGTGAVYLLAHGTNLSGTAAGWSMAMFGSTFGFRPQLAATDGTTLVQVNPGTIPVALNDGNYHLIIGVIDRGAQLLSVYVDGVLRGTPISIASLGSLSNATAAIDIGVNPGNSNPYTGSLGQVILFPGALTPQQIETLQGALTGSYAVPPVSSAISASFAATTTSNTVVLPAQSLLAITFTASDSPLVLAPLITSQLTVTFAGSGVAIPVVSGMTGSLLSVFLALSSGPAVLPLITGAVAVTFTPAATPFAVEAISGTNTIAASFSAAGTPIAQLFATGPVAISFAATVAVAISAEMTSGTVGVAWAAATTASVTAVVLSPAAIAVAFAAGGAPSITSEPIAPGRAAVLFAASSTGLGLIAYVQEVEQVAVTFGTGATVSGIFPTAGQVAVSYSVFAIPGVIVSTPGTSPVAVAFAASDTGALTQVPLNAAQVVVQFSGATTSALGTTGAVAVIFAAASSTQLVLVPLTPATSVAVAWAGAVQAVTAVPFTGASQIATAWAGTATLASQTGAAGLLAVSFALSGTAVQAGGAGGAVAVAFSASGSPIVVVPVAEAERVAVLFTAAGSPAITMEPLQEPESIAVAFAGSSTGVFVLGQITSPTGVIAMFTGTVTAAITVETILGVPRVAVAFAASGTGGLQGVAAGSVAIAFAASGALSAVLAESGALSAFFSATGTTQVVALTAGSVSAAWSASGTGLLVLVPTGGQVAIAWIESGSGTVAISVGPSAVLTSFSATGTAITTAPTAGAVAVSFVTTAAVVSPTTTGGTVAIAFAAHGLSLLLRAPVAGSVAIAWAVSGTGVSPSTSASDNNFTVGSLELPWSVGSLALL